MGRRALDLITETVKGRTSLGLTRLGGIHPANAVLAHELCATLTLGIDPDDAPRCG